MLTWAVVEDGRKIERGRQPMNAAVEILGYSTDVELQTTCSNCFMVVCLDRQLHVGVLTRKAKDQWIVALSVAMERASKSRFAYRSVAILRSRVIGTAVNFNLCLMGCFFLLFVECLR